ncbi:hypothetical protein, partial [uncultured Psychroserpens sp.]|uniref:hypothetical protein n=1 Tax=uncultured Psychroserpens sp. TaxID=255436 RepID=UPI00262E4864
IEMPNSVNGNLVLVTFTYNNSQENYTASVSRTSSRVLNPPNPTWNDYMAVPYNASVTKPKEVHSYYTIGTTTKKLSRITFRDDTYVQFDTHPTLEHPETEGELLEYIRIKDANNIENKHYKLVYEDESNPNGIGTDRLWLNEIREVANGQTNSYVIEYNDKLNLPPFDSVNSTDDWGYNTSDSSALCGVIVPDSLAITKGLLSKIIYPTGGSKEFEFERHRITYERNNQLTDEQYKDKNPDNW